MDVENMGSEILSSMAEVSLFIFFLKHYWKIQQTYSRRTHKELNKTTGEKQELNKITNLQGIF